MKLSLSHKAVGIFTLIEILIQNEYTKILGKGDLANVQNVY